jgi:LCP family protein required for cell wall assembly
MPNDPDSKTPRPDVLYRVFRAGDRRPSRKDARPDARIPVEVPQYGLNADVQARDAAPRGQRRSPDDARPYTVYRARRRDLRARLRGEEDIPGSRPRRRGGTRNVTPRRVLKWLAVAVVAWLGLSVVLFLVSAQTQQGSIPTAAKAELTPGGNMLTSATTILILGTEQAPKAWNWRGDSTSDAGSDSDTIMLWRVGGGVSRRLSIPRDTVANIPGYGTAKINAAYAYGGPALAIKTIEQFTAIKINHVIVVNLANFPPFINAIGGIDVRTDRICSTISGGTKNGGWSLNLSAGVHHLNGTQALVLARTRDNTCNPAETDLTREMRQHDILNAIKAQLESPSTFLRLPWASWDAPKVLRSDMSGFTLLSMFAAAEIGGSAPVHILHPTGAEVLPNGEDALTVTPNAVHSAISKLING